MLSVAHRLLGRRWRRGERSADSEEEPPERASDQDVCEERVTRIELAFTAWEAERSTPNKKGVLIRVR